MAYPEYDPNEPTLRQTIADLLRGMNKKQSYQELGQGIQNTAKIIPSVVESLGRGALVQLPALAGDTSQLARQFIPETMQNTFGNRTAPTSEELLAKIPRINPNYQGSEQHEMVGGLVSPAMPYLLRAGAKATQNMPLGNMIAYHGTPHEIQGAFDLKKVGTGEGAQAYGHGMYFAESPKVAESYKDLSKNVLYTPEGKVFDIATELKHPNIRATLNKNKNIDEAIERAKQLIKTSDPNFEGYQIAKKELDLLENFKKQGGLKTGEGNLYKVDIPDAYIPTMMDYDKPLGQQSAIVKKALNNIRKQITPEMKMELGGDLNLLFGKDVTPVQFLNTMEIIHPTGGVGIGEKMLNELGVKGMRYLDATSRDANKGTSNFVVFDPKEVKILEKNSKPVSRKDIIEEQIDNLETTSLIKSKPTDVSNTFGKGAERIQYKDPTSEGFINVLVKPDGTASVLGLEVPEKFRGKGIGQKLQSQVLQDFPQMQGQVSSKAAAKNAYKLGRRPVGQPNATLDDVFKAIDENSSINLVSPKMQEQINKL